jgi:hypothetical protein
MVPQMFNFLSHYPSEWEGGKAKHNIKWKNMCRVAIAMDHYDQFHAETES